MSSEALRRPESNWAWRVCHVVVCTLSFALTFAALCWGIHEALPFPDVPIVSPKVEHLAAHGDRYDTLIIGSSRLYYQFIPFIFDELTSKAGIPTKTFNAAVAGMGPPEDAFVVDQILRRPPKHLRWVFIELARLRLSLDPDKIGTVRSVYWHDWPRLTVLFRRALVQKKKRRWTEALAELRQPLTDFADHLRLFAQNQTNLGRASIFADRLRRPAARAGFNVAALGPKGDGWMRTGRPEQIAGRELAEYERSLADRAEAPAVKDFGDPVSQAALETILRKIEMAGARPVLIVPPTTGKQHFFPQRERARSALVLDFSDMRKYPELYRTEYRLDMEHLNTAGAEVFTRVLAEEFQRATAAP